MRFPPSPTGNLHVGQRPQRPVQLGLRPPLRRHVRAAGRGHRRRPEPGRVLPGALRLARLARAGLGRGPRRRRPVRAVHPERAGRDLPRRRRPAARVGCRLPLLLHARGDRGPRGRPAEGRPVGLRRLLPQPAGRARRAARGRRRAVGGPDAGARRRHRLRRPGPRRGPLRRRARARLRPGPGQRRAALHAGQPGRRRADGDHPRAARRGPAALDAAPDRAVRGAGPDRRRLRPDAAVRAPADRAGGGQPPAVQARQGGRAWPSTASRATCPRAC